MTPINIPSISYEKRVVAFVDILGFAELVKFSERDSEARERVGKILAAYKFFEQLTGIVLPVITGRSTFFSDSFIVSMASNRILYLVKMITELCWYLFGQGFICRGAITSGDLFHEEGVVIGPAFVRAYLLEQSTAIYPRILIDNAAMEHWRFEFRVDEDGTPAAHCHLERAVKCDRDGQYFLDLFSKVWPLEFFQWAELAPAADFPRLERNAFLNAARHVIDRGRIIYATNEKILAKYEWLSSQLRELTE